VTLRKAFQEMTKVHGIADTAVLMEMSESSVDNRIYERKGQEFTVRQALRLQDISKTTFFAEVIAKMSGGTFVRLPEIGEIDNQSLLSKFMELQTELGTLSEEFTKAIKNDEIDQGERRTLESIADEMHKTINELTGLMFRIYCREPAPKSEAA
jgi:exoribonuclease II